MEVLHKATVIEAGDWVKLTGFGIVEHLQDGPTNPIDQFSQLQFVREWELEVHPVGLWSMLLHDLHASQGFMVSEGSYCQGSGAAVWIIEGATLQNRILGESVVPSHDDDHSLF